MKKKSKKYEKDFFQSAKKIVGEKRYNNAVKKGQAKANVIRLKMARELLGKNQTDLKGLTQPEVSKIEARKDLKISTLEKYANALGMKVEINFVSEEDDVALPIAIYG
ncbi:MAG: helix-turn-helix transcriptional regulator [Bacteriovoracaceae bacterium]|nr:helix-turn-helix transcriptional regulator [Bacteriovoracaceae bacterium]